jgi:hypothetical protein
MTNQNNKKFNTKGATKGYFPIKQHRFDTSKHPVIQSTVRCAAKMQALLSQQEELMVAGLVNCLQCKERDAVRIALYELRNNSDPDFVESLVPASSAVSKLKGHSSRDRKLSVSLPAQEKADAEELADELGITPKELVRLAIIHLAKGIRTEHLTKLTNTRKISQQQLAKEWSRANHGKPPSARTKALKETAAQAYKEAAELGSQNDWERYEARGRMMDVLNWEGVGRVYANANPDGSGSISLEVIDVHLQIEHDDDGWHNELEDEIEQLAEDRRKAAYTEAVAARWFVDYGEELSAEDLEFYWQDYLDRQIEMEQAQRDLEELELLSPIHGPAEDITLEEMNRRKFGHYKPIDLSHLDCQPDEVWRDWLLRISGQQIVDRMELLPDGADEADRRTCLENRWWLRLTGRQYEAAKAIQQETGKGYEHITLSEINATITPD